jgi:hypothetical protein
MMKLPPDTLIFQHRPTQKLPRRGVPVNRVTAHERKRDTHSIGEACQDSCANTRPERVNTMCVAIQQRKSWIDYALIVVRIPCGEGFTIFFFWYCYIYRV